MRGRHALVLCAVMVGAALLFPGSALARSPAGIGHPRFGHPHAEARPDVSKIPSLSARAREGMWFVQLSASPVASYRAAALASGSGDGVGLSGTAQSVARIGIERQQTTVRPQVTALGAHIESTFTDVLNGFRVTATGAQISRIARLPGVKRVYKVPEAFRSDLASADYIGASSVWNSTGFTGAGVTIAIIDTGINYYHRNFAGAGNPGWNNDDPTIVEPGTFPTAKVVGGYDFVGDDYDPDSSNPADQTPVPDPDPLDCKSPDAGDVQHGSHVAGIAAGTGVTSSGSTYTGPYTTSAINATSFRIGPGAAPKAKLMALRVFGCDGGTFVTLDAIEMAVRSGADVINMSLGSPLGNPDSIDSVAADNAAAAGVTVVASVGNEGPSAYEAGSPGVASRVIAVGAMDSSVYLSDGAIVDFPGSTPDVGGWNMYQTPLPVTGPMRVLTEGSNLSNGCEASDFSSVVAGDVVTIVRGDCDFSAKRGLAQDAGAVGVVLVNNVPETVVSPVPDPDHDIPMISTDPSQAAALEAGDGLSTTLHTGNVPNTKLGDVASFTSAGPRRGDDMIKPDVSAPGVDVFSTDGSTVNQGKSLSGTSMAAPNTAGAAALILQAHPNWGPAHVKAALVGTASPGKVDPYTLRLSGSGVINVQKAVKTVSWAQSTNDPGTSSLTFGYQQLGQGSSPVYTGTKSFRLTNDSNQSIIYDLTNQLNTPSLGVSASFPSSVTVPAKSSRVVGLTLSMSKSAGAALPDAAPGDAPVIEANDTNLFVPLTHVAGALVATPTTGGTGHNAIRVPWLVTPRGTSDIQPGKRQAYTVNGDIRKTKLPVKDSGIHGGNVDVFAWGLEDQREGIGSIDLRAAGVQSLPTEICTGTADATDRCIVFAINIWDHWSNASENEYDVPIDVDKDGQPDYLLAALDSELIFGPGPIEGVPIVAVLDLTGVSPVLVDIWLATAAPNGSTILMPVLASEIGRTSTKPGFRYWVESFEVADDSGGPGNEVSDFDQMLTGSEPSEADLTAKFNAFDNPVSNGNFLHLDPGQSTQLNLSVDKARYDPTGSAQKGWLLANLEDANGAPQADLVYVGELP